MNKHSKNQVK